VDALERLIRDHGGTVETGRDVERVLVESGRAVGVQLEDGETVVASRAVIANVTPTQLYGRLLADGDAPAPIAEQGRRFRYGRAEMQIHFALSEPARWEGDERLGRSAIVHLTPGLDGVSRAVNEADRGLLPAEATVVVGQPLTMDPSRAPAGAGLLWIQLQELPWHVRGDAAGELDVGNGTWTEELRERYADRIQARIARHVPNLESALVKRVVLSPADLQAANVNLHHGDPYSGSLALDQNFLWRPFAASPGHATAVERLWHIGASTHPGPGLGAGSGTLVAKALLEPPLPARTLARVRGLVGR
jgi:phytoene dehydrogenase-like protein